VGHSMGGMIAMKLAVLSPQRVCSLSIVSATGGGWQSLPFSWRAAKYMWRVRLLVCLCHSSRPCPVHRSSRCEGWHPLTWRIGGVCRHREQAAGRRGRALTSNFTSCGRHCGNM
jgi:pimeloyl-ACP methyl ester carboxylesterase